MKRFILPLLLLASCAGQQKKTKAPNGVVENAAQPVSATTPAQPRPGVPEVPAKTTAVVDPWADRKDLFVAPPSVMTTKVNLGHVERFNTKNGVSVIVVPRKAVGSVDVTLAIETGTNGDPLDKSGLAEFTASMLRKGTKKRSSDQIAEAIDFVGGSLGANAGNDATIISCHARAKDLALCLDLVGEMAQNPTFPESEMAEVRDQLNASVEGSKDSPQALAYEHAGNLFYGDEDPRGRPMSKQSIARIKRDALVEFHHAWYVPANATLAVSGEVDARKVKAQLQRTFGSWHNRAMPAKRPRETPVAGPMKVRIVDKPDATQSTVVVAGPGIAHSSPDYFATRLMNWVLGGGGFSSRLMRVVRSEGGKTYGASSSFQAERDPGPFVASTFTRNDQTGPTLKLVLDEIAKMRAGGPNAAELQSAKGNLIGGYGLRLETGSDLANALLMADVDGLDPAFVEKYPERMNAVTLPQAAEAAAKHLTPTTLVVVGKAEDIKPQLVAAGYASPEVVAYTEPVSAAERAALKEKKAAAAVTPAEAAAGKRLLDAALAARGGTAALAGVKDMTASGSGTMTAEGQKIPISIVEYVVPGKSSREEIAIGPMKIVQVVSGGKAWMKQGDRQQELPPAMVAHMQKGLWRDPRFLLLRATEPGAQVRALPAVTEGGATYDALEIIAPDGAASARALLDPKTHYIVRLTYQDEGKESRDDLGDYRAVGDIPFAHKTSRAASDGSKVDITYDKMEVNKGVSPKLFTK